MARRAALLLALTLSLVRAEVEVRALASDDECGDAECSLNALQVKSQVAELDDAFAKEVEISESELNETVGNCVKAYHQTDPRAGASIMRGGFKMGYAGYGIAGKALYFSTSIQATKGKAQHKGFCFEVQLCLGNSKKLPRWPNGPWNYQLHRYARNDCCTYRQLQSKGYDSATIERGGFYYREYAMYNDAQIKVDGVKQLSHAKRGVNCCIWGSNREVLLDKRRFQHVERAFVLHSCPR